MDEILPGGVANARAVVRRGEFVLRPSNPHSAAVHAFLRELRSTGFAGASFPIEIQADGCERMVFIEGDVPVPPFPDWAQSDDELADPAGGSMICHNDVCLENVVFRNGRAVGLLDFDFAAPGRPIFDLAAFARMCIPIDDDLSAGRVGFAEVDRPARLRMVADAYGLDVDGRHELLEHLDRSMRNGGAFIQRRVDAGDANFIRMLEGMGGMNRYQRRLTWWQGSRHLFVTALV